MKCQLCSKAKYPIKEIEGHYYHMTCLIFFNLVTISNGKLVFAKGVSPAKVLQMVVDS